MPAPAVKHVLAELEGALSRLPGGARPSDLDAAQRAHASAAINRCLDVYPLVADAAGEDCDEPLLDVLCNGLVAIAEADLADEVLNG